MDQQFELVHVYCNKAVVIMTGTAPLCQWKRMQLLKDPAYKPGLLQVRRQGATKFALIAK